MVLISLKKFTDVNVTSTSPLCPNQAEGVAKVRAIKIRQIFRKTNLLILFFNRTHAASGRCSGRGLQQRHNRVELRIRRTVL